MVRRAYHAGYQDKISVYYPGSLPLAGRGQHLKLLSCLQPGTQGKRLLRRGRFAVPAQRHQQAAALMPGPDLRRLKAVPAGDFALLQEIVDIAACLPLSGEAGYGDRGSAAFAKGEPASFGMGLQGQQPDQFLRKIKPGAGKRGAAGTVIRCENRGNANVGAADVTGPALRFLFRND